MATRNIIPNGDGEGNFGSVIKRWIKGWFVDVYVSGSLTDGTDSVTINDLANPPGGGDMLKATYDPTSVNADAFDMDEMSEGVTSKILTAAERTTIGNQSGTNTGDQDLSGLALKSNVLELDNISVFVPDADYEPATKKYVDDNSGGGGDMLKATYDPTNVNADAFDMDEMSEGVTNKILTTAERTTISNQSGTNTGDEVDATESIKGIVERATDAEVAAGTDTTRYITSKQYADNLPSGSGSYFKAEVTITSTTPTITPSSASAQPVPGLTYTITQDKDYVFYAMVTGDLDNTDAKPFEIMLAKNGSVMANSITGDFMKKNEAQSVSLTFPIDGLVATDVIAVYINNDNIDVEITLGRMLIQSWT